MPVARPARTGAAGSAAVEAGEPARTFEALSAVVVDPNRYMRNLCLDMLRSLRFGHSWGVDAPAEAASRMRDFCADVVITDYNLPGMNGIDFARILRTGKVMSNPFVPIIMVTEFATLDIVRAARDAGINEFLAKPISPKALFERLAECLLAPRPFVAAPRFFGPDRRRGGVGRKPAERRADLETALEQEQVMLFEHEWQPVIGSAWTPRPPAPASQGKRAARRLLAAQPWPER
jgi:CheY-like chemotaxis protein